MNLRVRLALLLLACAALPAHAMTLPPGSAAVLHPGTRIRWSSPPDSTTLHVGRVASLASDTLVVADERGSTTALALPEVSSLEVSTPTNHAARYALMGAIVGATTCAGAVAIVDWAKVKATTDVLGVESEDSGNADASAYVTAALIGAGLGAIIGGIMGSRKPGPERWKPVHAMVGFSMRQETVWLAIRF